jgi:putative endonuclease
MAADWQAKIFRNFMHYVYIIKSINHPDKKYIGITINLKKRIFNHNSGTTQHTTKYKPWKLVLFIGFQEKDKATDFEKYLKSGSGRAFVKKHFL